MASSIGKNLSDISAGPSSKQSTAWRVRSAAAVALVAVVLFAWLGAVLPAPTFAASLPGDFPPHLNERGKAAYGDYRNAAGHKAFVIAPGGAWAWAGERESEDMALAAAIDSCQTNTRTTLQTCVPYAIGERRVFDTAAWPRLWGPYLTHAQAAKVPIGKQPGERFFDLAFRDPTGRPASVSGLRGKVVILHFWGSWCPPCRREMPDLQALHDRIKGDRHIALMALQVREPYATAQAWVNSQKIALPLADSGAAGETDEHLKLADGGRVRDREIATMFPTTYVLDKHGIVLFAHIGPVHDWPAYEGFLREAAARSGR